MIFQGLGSAEEADLSRALSIGMMASVSGYSKYETTISRELLNGLQKTLAHIRDWKLATLTAIGDVQLSEVANGVINADTVRKEAGAIATWINNLRPAVVATTEEVAPRTEDVTDSVGYLTENTDFKWDAAANGYVGITDRAMVAFLAVQEAVNHLAKRYGVPKLTVSGVIDDKTTQSITSLANQFYEGGEYAPFYWGIVNDSRPVIVAERAMLLATDLAKLARIYSLAKTPSRSWLWWTMGLAAVAVVGVIYYRKSHAAW